jgi:hypothetical protein
MVDLLGKVAIPLVILLGTLWVAKKQISHAATIAEKQFTNAAIIAEKQIISSSITQFRQKWIDNLRDAISLFAAKAEMIAMLEPDEDEQYIAHFKELSMMEYKIQLMLNLEEKDHEELITLVEDIRELIHDEESYEDDAFDEILDEGIAELLEVSAKVLKREWNVVKQGR